MIARSGPSTHNVYAGALSFLYDLVLERPEVMRRVPRRKQLLSPADVVRLLAPVPSITVRKPYHDLLDRLLYHALDHRI